MSKHNRQDVVRLQVNDRTEGFSISVEGGRERWELVAGSPEREWVIKERASFTNTDKCFIISTKRIKAQGAARCPELDISFGWNMGKIRNNAGRCSIKKKHSFCTFEEWQRLIKNNNTGWGSALEAGSCPNIKPTDLQWWTKSGKYEKRAAPYWAFSHYFSSLFINC